jgi:hypothetical protein
VIGNDGAEALGRTQRWHGSSREDSMVTRAPLRSTTAWDLGKISVGNFGNLMV